MGADDSISHRLKRIIECLRPQTDVVIDYETCFKETLKGTGEWILRADEFKEWKENKTKDPHEESKYVLWVSGPPGCGKSHLSAQLIRHITYLGGEKTNVAMFFCRDNIPSRRMFSNVIRTLVWQLARNDPAYAIFAHELCEDPRSDIENMSIGNLWDTFLLPYSGCSNPPFIFIDGLDEAYQEDVDAFLAAISANPHNFKILLAGRPELDRRIETTLIHDIHTIHVTRERNGEDIAKYIDYQISRSPKLKAALSPAFYQEVKSELGQSATSMFLWVNLMISELASKAFEGEVAMRETLLSLPKDLTEAYIRTLYRYSKVLNSYSINNLNKLLAWVLCATRPLTLLELQAVLEMDDSVGERADSFDLENNVRENYASFLTILKLRGGREIKDKDEECDLDSEPSKTEIPPPRAPPVVPRGQLALKKSPREVRDRMSSLSLKLCHASLGDFFRSRTSMTCAVGTTGTRAAVWLLVACLKIMVPGKVPISPYVPWPETLGYATSSWYKHLADLDVSQVHVDDKVKIVQGLYEFFSTGDPHIHYMTTYRVDHTPFDQELPYFSNIKVLLTDDATVRAFVGNPEVTKWMQTVSSCGTAEKLLEPIAVACGKHWLQAPDPDTPTHMSFNIAWNFYKKNFAVKLEQQHDRKPKEYLFMKKYPVDDIYEVAKRAAIEPRNHVWHLGVSRILRDSGHLERAREECHQALGLDPESHAAMERIAKTYQDQVGNVESSRPLNDSDYASLKTALEWLKKAYEAGVLQLEQRNSDASATIYDLKYTLSEYLREVAHLEELLGSKEAKTKTMHMRMEADPASADLAYDYYSLLTDEEFLAQLRKYEEESPGRFTSILGEEAAARMSSLEMMVHDMSTDMVFNRYAFPIRFMDAAYRLGDGDFFVMAMERHLSSQLDTMRKNGRSEDQIRFGRHRMYEDWSREKLGVYYLGYTGETEKAVKQFEDILEGAIDYGRGTRLTTQQEYSACLLVKILFDRAMADPAALPRLEKFATESELMRETCALQSPANSLITNVYRTIGNTAAASSIAKRELHRLFAELEEINETSAGRWGTPSRMIMISRALFAAGDDDNGAIAHWLGSFRPSKKDSQDEEVLPWQSGNNLSCAGGCSRSDSWIQRGRVTETPLVKTLDEGYHDCLYCFDSSQYMQDYCVRFCDDCYSKLLNGEQEFKTCNPKHRFFHRVQGEAHRDKDGKYLIGGEDSMIDPEVWLNALKKRWGYCADTEVGAGL